MIEWEELKLEKGVTAEFPLDLIHPSETQLDVFYWDENKKEAIKGDSNEDFVLIPTYKTISDDAKEKMESVANESFDYQGVELISGDTKGFGIFQKWFKGRKNAG